MKIRTLFLGSNWEALATLKTLHEDDRFEVVGIITQPDKPVGRKKEIKPTEIKKYALEHKIQVFHTEKDPAKYDEALEVYKPELIVCKSFGEIIPGKFLDWPRYKAINVHFSLLPKYRGAVPIQAAILTGDQITGITVVQMVEKLDAGPILATYEEKILPEDTNQTLRERLVEKSTKVLPGILEKWVKGEIEPTPQDDSKATFCKQSDISKEKAQIKWDLQSPELITRMVRAFIPWPVAWTYFDGRRMKIFNARLVENNSNQISLAPGEFSIGGERLFVGTNDRSKLIQLLEVQIEGRNRMTAEQFIRGRDL